MKRSLSQLLFFAFVIILPATEPVQQKQKEESLKEEWENSSWKSIILRRLDGDCTTMEFWGVVFTRGESGVSLKSEKYNRHKYVGLGSEEFLSEEKFFQLKKEIFKHYDIAVAEETLSEWVDRNREKGEDWLDEEFGSGRYDSLPKWGSPCIQVIVIGDDWKKTYVNEFTNSGTAFTRWFAQSFPEAAKI